VRINTRLRGKDIDWQPKLAMGYFLIVSDNSALITVRQYFSNGTGIMNTVLNDRSISVMLQTC
jgi:hypothetical protein